MIYLVRPGDDALRWLEAPESILGPLLDAGTDLADLPWEQRPDVRCTEDDVRAALRHGLCCRDGLVVPALVEHWRRLGGVLPEG